MNMDILNQLAFQLLKGNNCNFVYPENIVMVLGYFMSLPPLDPTGAAPIINKSKEIKLLFHFYTYLLNENYS